MAESHALRGELPGARAKNLCLKPMRGGSFCLAVLEATHRVPVDALAGRGRMAMASAEDLQAVLGVEPGLSHPSR